MQAHEIRAEMVRNKLTVTQVAKEAGVSIPLASLVIKGVTGNKRVRDIISRGINRPINEIWPESGQ